MEETLGGGLRNERLRGAHGPGSVELGGGADAARQAREPTRALRGQGRRGVGRATALTSGATVRTPHSVA